MVVGAEAAERNQRGRSREAGVAEIVVLIFQLARPVRGEHVFETGTDGVTVAVVAAEAESDRRAVGRDRLVVVGEGIAALYVEQARTPGVTEAARDGAEATLVVREDGVARKHDAAVVAAEPAVLGFCTHDPVRCELVIGAALQTAAETAVAVVAGGQAANVAVARERATEVRAEVKAGPVIERSSVSRRLGIGRAGREVGCECWHGRAEGDEGHSCK